MLAISVVFWSFIQTILAFCFRSERVGKTGVVGTLLSEAKYINLSLHFLEQVSIGFFVFFSRPRFLGEIG